MLGWDFNDISFMLFSKHIIRKTALAHRHVFVTESCPIHLQELNRNRLQQFFKMQVFQKILTQKQCVAVYHSLPTEAPTTSLIETLHQMSIPLALPRVTSLKSLNFHTYVPGDPLIKSPLGISEPLQAAPFATPQIYIVPLVAYTAQKYRLGYGKGYYDRHFTTHPNGLTVGWAHPCQYLDAFPIEPHDIPLDYILTGL